MLYKDIETIFRAEIMNIFANNIHRKYKRGCMEMIEKAVKLHLPIMDMLFILYCYNQAFKSPFLDKEEFYAYSHTMTFGDIMEELFVARDLIRKNMSNELIELESHFSVWHRDIVLNN